MCCRLVNGVRRSSRSRAAELSVPESDELASQQLAYHAFVDCDLHPHYHYGRHIGRHGDDVHHLHHHQQLMERQSVAERHGRAACETPYDSKCGVEGGKHQYEAPHNVEIVYCQAPVRGTSQRRDSLLSGTSMRHLTTLR